MFRAKISNKQRHDALHVHDFSEGNCCRGCGQPFDFDYKVPGLALLILFRLISLVPVVIPLVIDVDISFTASANPL
jgi:hypothetical protein